MPEQIHRSLSRRRAEPADLRGVELRLPVLEEWLKRHRVLKQRDHGAVLWRDIVQVIGGAESAGGWHVLRHDGGIARNMLAKMFGDGARVDVVAAADRRADDEVEVLALVEIRDGVSARRTGQDQRQGQREQARREHW